MTADLRRAAGALTIAALALVAPPPVAAQQPGDEGSGADPEGRAEPAGPEDDFRAVPIEGRPGDGPRPALPPPTLEEEDPVAPPEPLPVPEEEEGPVILHRIGRGDHPEWEGDEEASADVAFEVPGDGPRGIGETGGGDLRLPNHQPNRALRLGGADPEEEPRTFEVGVAAGYARLLADETFGAIDFGRLEQRFEARIPELELMRLGAGATQMVGEHGYLVGGGLRIGFGAFFCDAGWLQCEGVATVQPGVLGGDLLGVRFDLNASLDVRLILEHLVEVAIGGGYSLLGTNSLFHITGQVGLVF